MATPPPLKSLRLSTDSMDGSSPTPTPQVPRPKGAKGSAARPRGRPPGAKNKVASDKPPNKVKKQTKKLPIYHNAHKLYQAQQEAGTSGGYEEPPSLVPQVGPAGAPNSQPSHQPPAPTTAMLLPNGQYQVVANPAYYNPAPPVATPGPSQQPPATVPPPPSDLSPSEWTIEQVVGQMSHLDPTLGPHVEMFRTHEIDGKALLLLTEEMMMKYMNMKLGPALKIFNIVNMLHGKKHQPLPNWN